MGRRGVWLGAIALGLLVAGCGRRNGRVLETHLPPGIRADYAVFESNCGKCHGLARPLNAPIRDVKHWDIYVAKMMRTPGSGISAKETPAILRFLYFYTRQKQARRRSRDDETDAPLEVETTGDTPAGTKEVQP